MQSSSGPNSRSVWMRGGGWGVQILFPVLGGICDLPVSFGAF